MSERPDWFGAFAFYGFHTIADRPANSHSSRLDQCGGVLKRFDYLDCANFPKGDGRRRHPDVGSPDT